MPPNPTSHLVAPHHLHAASIALRTSATSAPQPLGSAPRSQSPRHDQLQVKIGSLAPRRYLPLPSPLRPYHSPQLSHAQVAAVWQQSTFPLHLLSQSRPPTPGAPVPATAQQASLAAGRGCAANGCHLSGLANGRSSRFVRFQAGHWRASQRSHP